MGCNLESISQESTQRDIVERIVPFKTAKSIGVRTLLFPESQKKRVKQLPPILENMLGMMALIFNVNEVDP
jgi:hypothetical protein